MCIMIYYEETMKEGHKIMEDFETKITVRYAETDQMAHHSVYAVWYEVARTEFAKKYIIPYSEAEKMGIMMPVAELTSKYYKSAFYEDELTIKTEIENYSPVRIKFKYSVYNQKNELINIGTSMHAWTGTDLKIMNLKKKFPEIYAKIEAIGTNK